MQTSISAVIRSIVSPVIAVTFTVVATTGVMMLLHVRSGGMKGLHEWTGVAMAVAGVFHLIVNWKAFTSLFRYRRAILACVLATVLSVALFAASSLEKKGERRHGGPPCQPTTVTPGSARG